MIKNTEICSSYSSLHSNPSSPSRSLIPSSAKASDSSSSSSDLPNECKINEYFKNEITIQPLCSNRLTWHSNEEIFKILCESIQLISLADAQSQYRAIKEQRFTDKVVQLPRNGSVFIFDRRNVKNYKKDAYCWKRRKTGSAKSVREDRMCLKMNGVECIYGCYSHSCLMFTFHRRIYW